MSTFPTPTIRRDRPTGSKQAGTVVAASGLTCTEFGFGPFRCTEFVFDSFAITITDALAYVGTKIYDFPVGVIHVLDASGAFTLTTTSAIASTLNSGVVVNWGVGSATASAATLANAMIDMLPGDSATLPAFASSTTIDVASATDIDYLKHATAQNAAAIFNGTSTATDVYFNLGVPTATDIDADATVELDGTLTLFWVNIGDGVLT